MHSRRRGFTLIELLVVIAIIAILAAILFPAFLAAKKRAQMTSCLSNLKQLTQAMRNYTDDNLGIMPNDWSPGGKPPSDRPGWVPSNDWCGCVAPCGWVYLDRGQIWGYVRNAKIYRCPSDFGRAAVKITNVPAGMSNKDYPLSYSMNHNVGGKNADVFNNATRRMVLIHENRGESASDPMAINDGAFIPSGQDYPGIVHYNGTTLSYLDGHAAWKPRTTLIAEYPNW